MKQNNMKRESKLLTFCASICVSIGAFAATLTAPLPEGIDNIPAGAFDGCAALTELTIPDSVTNIGAYAFFGCTNLQRLVIGSGVVSVPNHELVFGYWDEENQCEVAGCDSLEYLELHSPVTASLFWGGDFPSVREIVIGDEFESLDISFFSAFPEDAQITAPHGIGRCSNGTAAVNGCVWYYREVGGLVEIYNDGSVAVSPASGILCVPNEIDGKPVVSIGTGAFGYLYYANIVLGTNVQSIAVDAFLYSGSGTTVDVAEGNSHFVKQGSVVYDAALTRVLFCDRTATNVTLPDTVRRFDISAFQDCEDLTFIEIPEGVEELGSTQLFTGSGLTVVKLPSTLKRLGFSAFMNCKKLKSITLPVSLEEIDGQAFDMSGIESITLPDSVARLNNFAFGSCRGLTNVTFGTGLTEIGYNALYGCTNLAQMAFAGNAPTVRPGAFEKVPSSCRVRVNRGSSGWGVTIPGVWNGFKIAYVGEDFAVLPELGEDPAAADVAAVVSDASDPSVAKQIDETNYNDFRTWAGCVTPKGSGAPVGLSGVMSAPNAWLSYALGSDTLIENAPTNGQMKVEKFEPTATSGSFDFTVSIDDIPVGDNATPSNLAKVFGIEGGTSPDSSSLSSENVNITFGTPENGKVKFTAGPKDTGSGAFFMRVKMTP